MPIYTYCNSLRQKGLTVNQSLAEWSKGRLADLGVQVPQELVTDCVRLCCSLCLLENDASIIETDSSSSVA